MASCSDSVTTDSQKTNSLSNRSDSQLDAEVTDTEIKGYLMKRARLSRKWKKQWFLLKNCDLYYSESPKAKGSLKKIPLTDADISETRVDKKQYAFQIRSKQNGRTYYIHAENEMTQNNWMQAICFAKAAGNNGGASQTCVVQ